MPAPEPIPDWEDLLLTFTLEIQDNLGRTSRHLAHLAQVNEIMEMSYQASARVAGASSWFRIWKFRTFEASVTTAEIIDVFRSTFTFQ